MSQVHRIPSKTFICGEYLVLNGGPAIVLVHEPTFEFEFQGDIEKPFPFDLASPAGIWWYAQKNKPHGTMTMRDPHHQQGGFGASSAQFIGVYCTFQNWTLPLDTQLAFKLWHAYRETVHSNKYLSPSGIDVLAQTQSPGIYWIDPKQEHIEKLPWLMPDWTLRTIASGLKQSTHQHLEHLQTIETKHLLPIVERCYHALKNAHLQEWVSSLKDYQNELKKMGLLAKHSQELLDSLAENKKYIPLKGCGAMGADVILLIEQISITPPISQMSDFVPDKKPLN